MCAVWYSICMSVDIMVEADLTGEYEFHCGHTTYGPYASRAEAADVADAHAADCQDCAIYGIHLAAIFDIDESINMSNTNAAMLLAILGYDTDDLCGSADAEDFLGRCMVALAEDRDQAAVPAYAITEPGRATITECGLPAGYVNTRLGELADIATVAMMNGRKVTWG